MHKCYENIDQIQVKRKWHTLEKISLMEKLGTKIYGFPTAPNEIILNNKDTTELSMFKAKSPLQACS